MKKRIVGMLVALIMICGILPAYAAGGIAPTEETWYVVPHSGDYRVYYYAAVTNNSSERSTEAATMMATTVKKAWKARSGRS